MKRVDILAFAWRVLWLCSCVAAASTVTTEEAQEVIALSSRHTNNWAVLVLTSRFWFNYRHMANVLSLYRTVKRLGIPDSQIILMLSDDIACNPRNAFPGSVFNNKNQELDLYGESIEVDYRGYEVTVENFVRLLTDRWDPDHPRSKRLLTDENSNIFVYLTGHGGDQFLKFQDAEEIGAYDLANAFAQMHEKKRYNEIFFMIDTCQANTMYEKIYSPNILAVGSSAFGESSYSHHSDMELGVAVIDRFTYYTLQFLEKINAGAKTTMDKLFDLYTFENVHSNPGIRTDLFHREIDTVLLTDFFGNVQNVVVQDYQEDILLAFLPTPAAAVNDMIRLNTEIPMKYAQKLMAVAGESDQKNTPISTFREIAIVTASLALLAALWNFSK